MKKLTMTASEKLEVRGFFINGIPTFLVDNMPYGGMKKVKWDG
ncbi:hypothetical protein ACHABW_23360 [Salipaludibacillus sp. CF4.18]